ncbi:MAG TPA: hypothetical protein VF829_01905 [Candidatus Paceibacterota bacterium]
MDKDKTHSKTVFSIDKQKFEVETDHLSVRQLLELAQEDPAQTTLALKKGNDLQKYTDLAENISLKDGMKFVILHNEPTTVS